MRQPNESPEVECLDGLIGGWSMAAGFPGVPPSDVRGRTVFDWMTDKKFVVQRWDVPDPNAPDGLAVIGFDRAKEPKGATCSTTSIRVASPGFTR